MDRLKEYQRLKTEEQRLTKEAHMAEARLESLQGELKKLGCNTLADARKRVKELERQSAKFTKQITKELKEFKTKWGEVL